MLKRNRLVYLLLAAVALLLAAGTGAYAKQEDVTKGACAKEEEHHTDRCTSGKENIWHYTYTDAKDGKLRKSWGYKSRASAQKGLESSKHLCQAVDRYWDHKDCQTTYGEIFCAGCEQTKTTRKLGAGEDDLLEAGERQLERWGVEGLLAAKTIKEAEESGQASHGSGIGKVLREYTTELKAARDRAKKLHDLMSGSKTGKAPLSELLTKATNDLEAATTRVETSRKALTQQQAASQPSPLSAVAIDGTNGAYGYVYGYTSISEAEADAKAVCRENGGKTCSVIYSGNRDVLGEKCSYYALFRKDSTEGFKFSEGCSSSPASARERARTARILCLTGDKCELVAEWTDAND